MLPALTRVLASLLTATYPLPANSRMQDGHWLISTKQGGQQRYSGHTGQGGDKGQFGHQRSVASELQAEDGAAALRCGSFVATGQKYVGDGRIDHR